jgi:hypothetical protein
MDHKGLRILLVVHGFITLAPGIVLAVAPDLILSVVGVHLEASANVVAYLLAGAEFGLAVLLVSNLANRGIRRTGSLKRSGKGTRSACSFPPSGP